MKKQPKPHLKLSGILKEHFQAFVLVGFDLDGKVVRICDYETPVQGHALDSAIRCECNENCQAPEVWIRNQVEP